METNMIKKLSLMILMLTCISGLNGMEEQTEKEMEALRFIQEAIQADDVITLRGLIQNGELDPNKEMELVYPHNDSASPLWFAVRRCSPQAVEMLLPLTTSDELFLEAFDVAIDSRFDEPPEGHESTCNVMIADLFLKKAHERGFDIKPILSEQLLSLPHRKQMQYLLSLGADRTIRYRAGNSLISEVQRIEKRAESELKKSPHNFISRKQYKDSKKIIPILRSYAPDLKTSMALNILNQVREERIGREYFQQHPLPRDIIELIAKLASVDPEAEEKWIAIGMPRYPLDEAEPMDEGE